jgi:tRNA A-37 threonylcarbamoyl transferase component Bud32
MSELGKPLIQGRTADIFQWQDGSLLKLYHAGFAREHAECEAENTRNAQSAGIRVPQVLDVISLGNRYGVVFSRIAGPTMLRALGRTPSAVVPLARRFAELHAAIHARRVGGLPGLRPRLEQLIVHAQGVQDAFMQRALKSLQATRGDDVLCHGDFHPMNIILASDGPVVLDWYKASSGDPALDVARTLMVINMVPVPGDHSGDSSAATGVRQAFSQAYQQRYGELDPACMQRVPAMLAPVAVARLATDISDNERAALIRLLGATSSHAGGKSDT